MEFIKQKEHFFEADPRSQSLGSPLPHQYELVSYFRLHDGVPESVRSYMNTVVTLWLYGWLYYPFYPLAVFHSTTAIEMALQERFPEKRGRGLKKLLQTAKQAGFLADAGFPSLQNRRDTVHAISGTGAAHPEMHTSMLPGMSVDALILAAEIINQLWPAPNPISPG
jgi:hypothetical protein